MERRRIDGLRVAVLAKQVPVVEELRLRPDGRLARDGLDLEINPYCRRAIAKGVELARGGGRCTVFTLGPPAAAELLREAVAFGADEGVLITDPAFAGSDTLATARALAAALRREGPYDIVLAGLNSVDADTGQVGPQVAELLGLPLLTGVRELTLTGGAPAGSRDGSPRTVTARCERDDGYVTARATLPLVLTAAERLCAPCKVPAERRAVPADRLRTLTAADLDPDSYGRRRFGLAGSPTSVGEIRTAGRDRRAGERLTGPLAEQVATAVRRIIDSGVLDPAPEPAPAPASASGPDGNGHPPATRVPASRVPASRVPASRVPVSGVPASGAPAAMSTTPGRGPLVAVVAQPGRPAATRELLGAAAGLAAALGGTTAVLTEPHEAVGSAPGSAPGSASGPATGARTARTLWSWGADQAVVLDPSAGPGGGIGAEVTAEVAAEDVAAAVVAWCRRLRPWAVLVPGTSWGREVAGRAAAALGAGLVGDAVAVEVGDGRLVCWKPAFGGRTVAAIHTAGDPQLATVRPGMLGAPRPRTGPPAALPVRREPVRVRGRVVVTDRVVDLDPARLAEAAVVVGIGRGVDPARYAELDPLLALLGAELAATRKVTDAGLLPRGRQVGITGRALRPGLYLSLGASGKVNHMVGTRGAGFVLAVNNDPRAPVFAGADAGIVGDWAEVVPLLVTELAGRLARDQGDGAAGSAAPARSGTR